MGPIYKQQYIIYVYINFHKSFHIQYINIDIHKNITTFFVRSMFSAQFIDVDLETIQPMNRILENKAYRHSQRSAAIKRGEK